MTTLAQAKTMLRSLIAANVPAMLWSAPGVGKSETAAQVFAELGMGFIDIRLGSKDMTYLTGIPQEKGGRTYWTKPEFWPEAADYPNGVGILVDEIADCNKAMQSAAYQLILDRQIGAHKLPANCYVMAAGNRRGDRAAAGAMSTALLNRFAHIEIEPDMKAWKLWAVQNDIAPELIAFLGFRPNLLHVMPEGDAKAFPTPRSWGRYVSPILKANPDAASLAALVAACVGEGAAAEFVGFLETYKGLAKYPLEKIMAGDKSIGAPGDDEPALKYAIASALARFANSDNFRHIVAYSVKLGAEFDAMIGTDAVNRDEKLATAEGFSAWALRNKSITARKA